MSDVSVIIPTYNPTAFLEEAILSALHQTHPPAEILLIDDGSADVHQGFIEKLCKSYAILRCVRLEQNSGVSSARNTGIANAQGDFILFLDDDDTLAPDLLEKSLQVFEKHPEVDVVVAKGQVFAEVSTPNIRRQMAVFKFNQQKYSNKPVSHPGFFLVYSPMIHAMLFRKLVFEKGLFPADLRYGEDRFLWMTLRRAGVNFQTVDWLGGYYQLKPQHAGDKAMEQRRYFETILSSGLLSSSYERSYAHSFLFLLCLRSGDIRHALKHLPPVVQRPDVVLGLVWKFKFLKAAKDGSQ